MREGVIDQPKYQQLIETVLSDIEQGTLELGQQLPSISEWASRQGVAKVTVAKAYEDLRQRGIVRSQHGKGFYVASTNVRSSLNVLVIFDTLNAYKETLYDALKAALPDDSTLSVFFHHYNPAVFETLVRNNLGRFNAYVLMPHFDDDVSDIVALIPLEKLLLLDQTLPTLPGDYSAVYQDFEQDMYSALMAAFERLRRYDRLTLVLSKDRFQYVPAGLLRGLWRFSEDFGFACRVVDTYSTDLVKVGEVFLLFADRDLVSFLKDVDALGLILGEQVGLLSYDDTPMKEILAGGISVISTDFSQMGQTAGQLLANRQRAKIANPGGLTLRHSL
ncbi:GntR family transcriptional regulator [Spirosoma sp. KNUC1025]|uniref:GntR family transcriptional regulator n=1 Tax=Spirosoma sp. KNUC1025 TaxID=2894082 RepID=UPI00386C2C89|nr:GntR family transcriptional regulator [Spirosoma sp. KNUC1025]